MEKWEGKGKEGREMVRERVTLYMLSFLRHYPYKRKKKYKRALMSEYGNSCEYYIQQDGAVNNMYMLYIGNFFTVF